MKKKVEYESKYSDSRALIVGISSYRSKQFPTLNEAEKDASDLAELITETPYDFKVKTLLGEEATRQAILDSLHALRSTKPNDRIIIYFAGHGYTQTDRFDHETGYLACSDTEFGKDHTALTLSDITDLRRFAGAKHITFLFDACFSGYALGLTRASSAPESKLLERRAFQVITAGAGDQTVSDYDSLTRYVLKRLKDASKSIEMLTTNMLGLDVQKAMTKASNKQQVPQFGNLRGSQGGDLILNWGIETSKNKDFHKWNLAQWESVIREIFPTYVPDTSTWVSIDAIVEVLQKVGSYPSLNHLFFPNGGGLDMEGAKTSNEQGCYRT